MGIDLNNGYQDLRAHIGHKIACICYGRNGQDPHNVALECETCGEVLIDFNHPDIGEQPDEINKGGFTQEEDTPYDTPSGSIGTPTADGIGVHDGVTEQDPGTDKAGPLFVVFDGPPGPESGRFVEVETADGHSVCAGEWKKREDGLWSLGPLWAEALSPETRAHVQRGIDDAKAGRLVDGPAMPEHDITNDFEFDEFLDDMTHKLCEEWEERGGRKVTLDEKYTLNDLLTQWFGGRR